MSISTTASPGHTGAGFWIRVIQNRLRLIAGRFLRSGFRSGWTLVYVSVANLIRRIQNKFLGARVECPCCGWEGYGFKYLDCGKFHVPNVECPVCRGHERHRMLHLFLTRRKPAFMDRPGRVLHFAPEKQIRSFIDQNPDLVPIGIDWDMTQYALRPGFNCDIHHLALPDHSFEGLYCIHVLEHVGSDYDAIKELYRVLKPGAEAVIMVPFMMHQTETEEYDGPDPEIFDHVRGYSPLDFKHRLAPFAYEEVTPASLLDPDEVVRFQIPDSQAIYLCRKTTQA